MSQFARLSVDDAYQMITDRPVNIVDIRDADSFNAGRIANAVHLENADVQRYIDDTDQSTPLIVCCYHGNMSQSAAAYLSEKGFSEVFSLDGGFAEWAARFPDDCEPE